MHPATSIVVFTVFSGLGFGLLFFIGLGLPLVTGWSAFWMLALGYALSVIGLLSSTMHLGHPERALKAFTQWRSSWLSREGWLAVATLIVGAVYGAGLVFLDARWSGLGLLTSILALATVFATSMIYAQLKTVPRWNHWTTPGMFLLMMLTGGALLAGQAGLATVLLIAAGIVQFGLWTVGDKRFAEAGHTIGSATGLGDRGKVRAFEPPHTGTNYLMKEMIHTVGRKHAQKLRILALLGMSVLPVLILLVLGHGFVAMKLAVVLHVLGMLAARWLFFAQAEHVVGLYYGKR